MEAMMAENQRLREHLRQLKAKKEEEEMKA
jgi:hypothetical protein